MYIVNCDKLRFFKTFSSFNSAISHLMDLNKSEFDGKTFSLFGRGYKSVYNDDGIEFIDSNYYMDSVVLCPKDDSNEYFTFFIRRIDTNGNLIELDNHKSQNKETQ